MKRIFAKNISINLSYSVCYGHAVAYRLWNSSLRACTGMAVHASYTYNVCKTAIYNALSGRQILSTTWSQNDVREWLSGQSAWLAMDIRRFKTGKTQIFFITQANSIIISFAFTNTEYPLIYFLNAVMESIQNTFIQNSILNTFLSIQKWILFKRKYSVFEYFLF